jgi:hypothetical protein
LIETDPAAPAQPDLLAAQINHLDLLVSLSEAAILFKWSYIKPAI